MNEDTSQNTPNDDREALEARIVAMLLGESSDFEKSTLKEAIEKDPELKAFHDSMKATIGLVEAAQEPTSNEAAKPKLDADRRDALLKTITAEPIVRKSIFRKLYPAMPALAACALIGLILAVTLPNVGTNKTSSEQDYAYAPYEVTMEKKVTESEVPRTELPQEEKESLIAGERSRPEPEKQSELRPIKFKNMQKASRAPSTEPIIVGADAFGLSDGDELSDSNTLMVQDQRAIQSLTLGTPRGSVIAGSTEFKRVDEVIPQDTQLGWNYSFGEDSKASDESSKLGMVWIESGEINDREMSPEFISSLRTSQSFDYESEYIFRGQDLSDHSFKKGVQFKADDVGRIDTDRSNRIEYYARLGERDQTETHPSDDYVHTNSEKSARELDGAMRLSVSSNFFGDNVSDSKEGSPLPAEATIDSSLTRNEESEVLQASASIFLEERLKTERSTDRPATPKTPLITWTPKPEVSAIAQPFSTFSLNISDVSFHLAAASLSQGAMPSPQTIRSEEFLNAFDYRDPAPVTNEPFSFHWDMARSPFEHNRHLIRFALQTTAEGRLSSQPLNITLLIDNSGSMERIDRQKILGESMRVLAEKLSPSDTVSVVTFAQTAHLLFDGITASDFQKSYQTITQLTPQGGTNLEAALDLAYASNKRHFNGNANNRVILMTDGAANLGDIEPPTLKAKVESQRLDGIALDAFGIGWENYNDNLLESITRNSDGRYAFLNTTQDADTLFAQRIAGAFKPLAADVKVQVEFNPGRVRLYRQIGYDRHQLTAEQFRDNTIDAAEIGTAESGNALYSVEIKDDGTGDIGVLRVRYRTPGTQNFEEKTWRLPYSAKTENLPNAAPSLRLAAAASIFAEWLAHNPYASAVEIDTLEQLVRTLPPAYREDRKVQTLLNMIQTARQLKK